MKKNILFIEINPGMQSTGARAIRICKEKGIGCYVLTSDKKYYDTPEGNPLDTADEVFEFPTDNKNMKESSKYVEGLMEKFNFVAVTSFSELYIETASYISSKLKLLHNNFEQISIARNKYKWRTFLSDNGIKMPRFMLIEKRNDLLTVKDKIGFPCIFKPVDGSSSVGVQYCTSNEDLKHAFDYWQSFNGFGRGITLKKEAMVEEYIDGPLYSAECINFNGNNYCFGFTDRKLSGAPYYVETRASFPCNLKNNNEVINEIYRVIDVIGFENCALHIEFILSKNGYPYIVDINARLGGGLVSQMIFEATGVDPIEVIIDMLLENDIKIKETKHKYATSRYIGSYSTGTVIDIHGISEIKQNPCVKQFESCVKNGDKVQKMISNRDTLFEFMVVGDSFESVNDNANKVAQNIHLIVDSKLCY